MYAWVGFLFSCIMMFVAAMKKAGVNWLPSELAATPSMEFMFLIGCAGFAASLAMLAPRHSSARLASLWSSGALALVVVVLNMDSLNIRHNKDNVVLEQQAIEVPQAEDEAKDEDKAVEVKVVLKKTINESDYVPFEDFDRRVRDAERALPPLEADNEVDQVVPRQD